MPYTSTSSTQPQIIMRPKEKFASPKANPPEDDESGMKKTEKGGPFEGDPVRD
jgi:hypothetical protein